MMKFWYPTLSSGQMSLFAQASIDEVIQHCATCPASIVVMRRTLKGIYSERVDRLGRCWKCSRSQVREEIDA
jgi:hypothetical protein